MFNPLHRECFFNDLVLDELSDKRPWARPRGKRETLDRTHHICIFPSDPNHQKNSFITIFHNPYPPVPSSSPNTNNLHENNWKTNIIQIPLLNIPYNRIFLLTTKKLQNE
jgi:hypothetical protein